VHIKGAHKNNNDNNTMPMFIGLNKATQKHGHCKRNFMGKDQELCYQTNVF
jgi:hypothetical protein